MPRHQRAADLTILGFGSRQKAVAVSNTDTLEDVRKSISDTFTLGDFRELLVGDDPNEEAEVSGYTFHHSDGTRISSDQEKEIKAVSLRSKSILIKARHHEPAQSLCWVFPLAVLGWTPPVWFSVKKVKRTFHQTGIPRKEKIKALAASIVLVLICFLDFSDAVVDLMIFFQDLVEGTEGDRTYGILLGFMTILARLLAGWYAVAHSKLSSSEYFDDDIEQLLIATYFYVELSVFMVEDGASILYLSNTHREDDLLTQINTILTSICGICFVCYNIFSVRTFLDSLTISVMKYTVLKGHTERRLGVVDNAKCKRALIVLLSLTTFGLAVAMVALLILEVWMEKGSEEQIHFSENKSLQNQWNIVYGIGAGLCLLLSSCLILNFGSFEEASQARREELEEYKRQFAAPNATKIPSHIKSSFSSTPSSNPSSTALSNSSSTAATSNSSSTTTAKTSIPFDSTSTTDPELAEVELMSLRDQLGYESSKRERTSGREPMGWTASKNWRTSGREPMGYTASKRETVCSFSKR